MGKCHFCNILQASSLFQHTNCTSNDAWLQDLVESEKKLECLNWSKWIRNRQYLKIDKNDEIVNINKTDEIYKAFDIDKMDEIGKFDEINKINLIEKIATHHS